MPIVVQPIVDPASAAASAPTAGKQPNVEFRGTFVPGQSVFFFVTFPNIDGSLYDPWDIDMTIADPDGTIIKTTDSFTKTKKGVWVFDWPIPGGATPGPYEAVITYKYNTTSGEQTTNLCETFIIAETGDGSAYTNPDYVAARAFLETELGYIQRLPVRDEQAEINAARTVATLNFSNWNQPASAVVYRNNEIITAGYEVDYLRGQIDWDVPLSAVDDVTVTYNFRWFTDDDLTRFIVQGINEINIWPPQTTWTIMNIPDTWITPAVYGAIINGLLSLMSSLITQEPVKVFGEDAHAKIETLKQNYDSRLKAMLENKKYGPWSGLTRTITVPEYALPGGRCLAADSVVKVLVGKTAKSLTMLDLYKTYENSQEEIKVLSQALDGSLSMECIYKIWKTGTKCIYKLTTETGKSIRTSAEHSIFVVDRDYLPMSSVAVGDYVICIDQEDDISRMEISQERVVSIKKHDEAETFDIEIPSTQNLFADGIKCHNSRWFRYLFKGSM